MTTLPPDDSPTPPTLPTPRPAPSGPKRQRVLIVGSILGLAALLLPLVFVITTWAHGGNPLALLAQPTATPTVTPTPITTPMPVATPFPTAPPTPLIPLTPTFPPVQLPHFTTWSASTSDPAISFTFTLDGGRTSIIAYSIHLAGYTCGGSGGAANGTVTTNGTWPITNRLFAIDGSLLYNATTTPFKIEGSFNVTGTYMDGVWMFSPNGADCSTVWRSTGS